jgi:steroid delta-isomerase-like uncharacterized protein
MLETALSSKQFIEEYLEALSGKPKTETVIDRYVNDPHLKEHILQTEAAFPEYALEVHSMIAEGETVAVRFTFHGTHKGPFAGIEATGKSVSADGMLFYEVGNGKIQKFWMQFDTPVLISQLTA